MGRARRRSRAVLDPSAGRPYTAPPTTTHRSAPPMTMTLQDPPIISATADLLSGSLIELGELNDDQGERRLIASRDLHGGLLVIDQDHRGHDQRLVSRLAPEEPEGNALLVAELYRADRRRHARPLNDDDWFA